MKQTRARSRQGFSVGSEHDSSYSATLSIPQVSLAILLGQKLHLSLRGCNAHRCRASYSNFPARMESSGQNGRIHVSKEFANLLQKAGKSNWLEERQDKVQAKGKGQLNTYWLHVKSGDRQSVTSTSSAAEVCSLDECGDRTRSSAAVSAASRPLSFGTSFLDEVKDIIVLPEYDEAAEKRQCDPKQVVLSAVVVDQLRSFVTSIAALYKPNHFHNFEHVSPHSRRWRSRLATRNDSNPLIRACPPAGLPCAHVGRKTYGSNCGPDHHKWHTRRRQRNPARSHIRHNFRSADAVCLRILCFDS
jgi:hypothetical protein